MLMPDAAKEGFLWVNDANFQFILEIPIFLVLSSVIIFFWLVFFFNK